MERRKQKKDVGNRITLVVIMTVVIILGGVLSVKGAALKEKAKAYAVQEQQLIDQIEDEKARTEALSEKQIYVQTREYIEKIAKERLSLVYPDEILVKAKD